LVESYGTWLLLQRLDDASKDSDIPKNVPFAFAINNRNIYTPPTRSQGARVAIVGKVPGDDVVKLGTLVVPPPRHRAWRHQFTLCVVHEIFEESIHSRHVLIAPQEDALVFTLYDTFG
jgi:hypothetical protein